jgi:malonyl-CoA decarboxylase
LCAYYLLQAKRGKQALDPVARFHLANGAQLARINWMGDTSQTGLKRSFGLTVNVVASIEFRRLGREAEQFFKRL